jgi:toxin-antitoxin system PIN domain toxin
VLVHACNLGSPHHDRAAAILRDLAGSAQPWALPWPCGYEFLRVATHPRVLRTPLAPADALAALRAIAAAPAVHLLAETPRHLDLLAEVLAESGATGNLVHNAHIWALCREHGVRELISGDRDFARFRGLRLTNPFA